MGISGTHSLRAALDRLPVDPFRKLHPFSQSIQATSETLWSNTSTHDERQCELQKWILENQPCLFGKIAAREDMVSYCILTRRDLDNGDMRVMERIQESRLNWYRDAFSGGKNAFIVLVADEALARGAPGPELQAFAQRLAYLYLLRSVEPDTVCHDEVSLRIPSEPDQTFLWLAGVNFFAAQGDGRWWNDHRIPGGVGFSVNSVGHFVAAAQRRVALKATEKSFPGASVEDLADPRLASLDDALGVAMMTINRASKGPHDAATYLVNRRGPPSTENEHRAAKSVPKALADKEFRSYQGRYHTDWTIPTIYFRTDSTVPRDARVVDLDFTYLFDHDIENIDHYTMGAGRRIKDRAAGLRGAAAQELLGRLTPQRLRIEDCPILSQALHRKA